MEKRRDKRLPITMKLEISSLFKQDNVILPALDAPIQVTNISKGGIGFTSSIDLPLGYYFNACLNLGQEGANLYSVIKIIRKDVRDWEDTYYGCELTGFASILSYIFDEYEKSLEQEE